MLVSSWFVYSNNNNPKTRYVLPNNLCAGLNEQVQTRMLTKTRYGLLPHRTSSNSNESPFGHAEWSSWTLAYSRANITTGTWVEFTTESCFALSECSTNGMCVHYIFDQFKISKKRKGKWTLFQHRVEYPVSKASEFPLMCIRFVQHEHLQEDGGGQSLHQANGNFDETFKNRSSIHENIICEPIWLNNHKLPWIVELTEFPVPNFSVDHAPEFVAAILVDFPQIMLQ